MITRGGINKSKMEKSLMQLLKVTLATVITIPNSDVANSCNCIPPPSSCTLQVVVVMYMGLWVVDGFPVLLVAVGILTHLCYGSLLSTFPIISLLSPGFIGGTCMYMSHVAPV